MQVFWLPMFLNDACIISWLRLFNLLWYIELRSPSLVTTFQFWGFDFVCLHMVILSNTYTTTCPWDIVELGYLSKNGYGLLA